MDSLPAANSTPHASGLRRLPIPFLIVATVLTLGLFYPVWFLWTRPKLKRLHSDVDVPAWPSVVQIVCIGEKVISVAAGTPLWDNAVLNLSLLSATLLMVYPAFTIKRLLERYLSDADTGSYRSIVVKLSAPQTFFFGAYYLQSAINTAILIEDSPEHLAQLEQEEQRQFMAVLQEVTPRVFVTPALIALNAVVFIAMSIGARPFMRPSRDVLIRWGADFGPAVTHGQWWRLGASAFLHLDPMHLFMNMVILWQVGRMTERMFGNVGYLVVYLVAAVGASLTSVLWQPLAVAAGASGAIFGLFGAVGAFLLAQRHSVSVRVLVSLSNGAAAFVGVNLALGALMNARPSFGTSPPPPIIDVAAHVGGLITGFLIGYAVAVPLENARNMRRHIRTALAAIASAVAAVTVARAVPVVDDVPAIFEKAVGVESTSRTVFNKTYAQLQAHEIDAPKFADVVEHQVLPPFNEALHTLSLVRAPDPQLKPAVKTVTAMAFMGESWQLRAEGVRNNDVALIERANRKTEAANEITRSLGTGYRPRTVLGGPLTVHGSIADDRNRPIAGAKVALTCTNFAAAGIIASVYSKACSTPPDELSDAGGAFRFQNLSPGPVIVTVTAGGYHGDERDFLLEQGRQLTFALRPLVDELIAALERSAEVEAQCVKRYNAALAKFKSHTIDGEQFANLIERQVVRPYQAARVSLSTTLGDRGQVPMAANIKNYMALRERSWQLAGEGLKKNDAELLKQASDANAAASKLAATFSHRADNARPK